MLSLEGLMSFFFLLDCFLVEKKQQLTLIYKNIFKSLYIADSCLVCHYLTIFSFHFQA